MIALFSVEQLRQWDALTIDSLGTGGDSGGDFILMQQAADALAAAFVKRYDPRHGVSILAGTGNNGGDGFCLATLLEAEGYEVEVLFFGTLLATSACCRRAYARWVGEEEQPNTPRCVSGTKLGAFVGTKLFKAPKGRVLVDALFGIGLSRPLGGEHKSLIEAVNKLPVDRLAVDVPSGLLLESPMEQATAFQAHHTLTLQVPKKAFLIPESAPFVGTWEALDIGLLPSYAVDTSPQMDMY